MAETTNATKPHALVPVQMDPQALIAKAIDKGAAIDTIERLVALAKEVRSLHAHEAYLTAVAEFKRRCPPIKKTKTASIATARSSYAYKYSPLDEVTGTVDPLLSELGLSYRWRHPKATAGHVAADCVLAHVLGHEESSGPVELPYADSGRMNPAQVVGSALTYAKRYSLVAILGLAPEDDDDAQNSAPAQPAKPSRDEAPYAPARATFPDDAQAERESQVAFPTDTEEQERGALIVEASRIAKQIGMTAKDRITALQTYGGPSATPQNIDLSALRDMVNFLRARTGQEKWDWSAA